MYVKVNKGKVEGMDCIANVNILGSLSSMVDLLNPSLISSAKDAHSHLFCQQHGKDLFRA